MISVAKQVLDTPATHKMPRSVNGRGAGQYNAAAPRKLCARLCLCLRPHQLRSRVEAIKRAPTGGWEGSALCGIQTSAP